MRIQPARLLPKIQFGLLVPKQVDMEITASRTRDSRKLHERPRGFMDDMQTVPSKVGLPQPSTVRVLLGMFLLTVGTGVYLLGRSWQHIAIADLVPLTRVPSATFGALGDSLPSFAHVCAFALLTAALVDGGRRLNQLICLGWLLVNVAFELGQHPKFAASVANAVPGWFRHVPILNQTPTYFLGGTFDPLDLLFATLGALTAYLVIVKTHTPGVGHEV